MSDRSDGIRWYPRCLIEKYSAEQVRWARERRDVPWARRLGLPLREVLHGNLLRMLFREPEGGLVYDEGNGVSAAGAANLVKVLTGRGGHMLARGRTAFGVGSDGTTGFSRDHATLSPAEGEAEGRSFYRPMDHGYPVPSGPAAIAGQATFTENEACFDWHEWCWAAGPGTPSPHHQLRGAYGWESPVMMNRKASPAGYGTKEAGVAWVFRTSIELRS